MKDKEFYERILTDPFDIKIEREARARLKEILLDNKLSKCCDAPIVDYPSTKEVMCHECRTITNA